MHRPVRQKNRVNRNPQTKIEESQPPYCHHAATKLPLRCHYCLYITAVVTATTFPALFASNGGKRATPSKNKSGQKGRKRDAGQKAPFCSTATRLRNREATCYNLSSPTRVSPTPPCTAFSYQECPATSHPTDIKQGFPNKFCHARTAHGSAAPSSYGPTPLNHLLLAEYWHEPG